MPTVALKLLWCNEDLHDSVGPELPYNSASEIRRLSDANMVNISDLFKNTLYTITVLAIFATTLALAQETTQQVGQPVGAIDGSVHTDVVEQGPVRQEIQPKTSPGSTPQPASANASHWGPAQVSAEQNVPGTAGDRAPQGTHQSGPELQSGNTGTDRIQGSSGTDSRLGNVAHRFELPFGTDVVLGNREVRRAGDSQKPGVKSALRFASPAITEENTSHSAFKSTNLIRRKSVESSTFASLKTTQNQRKKKSPKLESDRSTSSKKRRLARGNGSVTHRQ